MEQACILQVNTNQDQEQSLAHPRASPQASQLLHLQPHKVRLHPSQPASLRPGRQFSFHRPSLPVLSHSGRQSQQGG